MTVGGGFGCAQPPQPVPTGSVAAASTTSFNAPAGGIITIPASAIAGDNPVLSPSMDVTLLLPVDGALEHFPRDQFSIMGAHTNCNKPHYHLPFGSATSLEGNPFFDNPDCGAGTPDQVRVQTLGIVDTNTALSSNYAIPGGGGVFVESGTALTVPTGLTLTAPATSALVNGGDLRVDGTVINQFGAELTNLGQLTNTSNTIQNFGRLTNRGTINNTGTIINECGGTVENTGVILGNPILQVGCTEVPMFPSGAFLAALAVGALGAALVARRAVQG